MPEQIQNRPVLGILLAVLAMSVIGYIDNFIQVIAGEAGLWQFHFCRAVVICVLIAGICRVFGWRLRPKSLKAVIWRSGFFSISMVAYFGAAGMIPLAQAAAGLFTGPIFVLVISALFYGVKIGIWRILAVVVGFVGVILILRPEQTEFSIMTVIPLLSGFFYALGGIATRRSCGAETTQTLLFGAFFGLGLFGALGLIWFTLVPASAEMAADLPFFTRGWVAPSGVFIFWTLVQAFGSLFAVALLTRGYQLTEASYVAVAEYWFLVSAAFWSYQLWAEVPDARAAWGIAAIMIAGLIIVMRSRATEQ
ncbi:MAG TPA: EamA/RhaT family transporter [Rhodobacteraceae bacterium]|jgi:drug/metabolite transporter (DMT)-like permease|nr:EamA/RhaT family transporter [Paracoccaceae bacterium]